MWISGVRYEMALYRYNFRKLYKIQRKSPTIRFILIAAWSYFQLIDNQKSGYCQAAAIKIALQKIVLINRDRN